MSQSDKRKLPAPVTTTEEFLYAAVLELRGLTAAVEQLVEVLSTVPASVELVADAGDWPETVALIEPAVEEDAAPRKRSKKG